MNEPAAVEPMPAPSEAGGRMGPAGFGYTLAQARVRAGLSIEQAAARIRLHPRQLQAIENEDLQLLPAAAYVNGFVRNYAREIGIDPTPLIDDLNAKLKLRGLAGAEPDLGAGPLMPAPILDDRGWRHLVLAGIVVALICAGLVGVWMARSNYRSAGVSPAPASTPPASSPGAGAAGPSPGKPDETSRSDAGAANPAGSPNPVTDAGVQAPTPAAAAPDSSAASTGLSSSAAGATGLPATAPDAGAQARGTEPGAAAGLPSEAAAAPAAGAKEARIPVATMPPPAGANNGLLLRFIERSWVEVSQPDGRVLLSHIGEAGSIELVNASAPLVLVIGRADAVKVEYRGQQLNLKPYVNAANGVARVLLAEGDAANGGQNNR